MNASQMKLFQGRSTRTLLYVSLGFAAVFLPVVLWLSGSPFVKNTYGKSYEVFELFGFCASGALLVAAYIELRDVRGAGVYRLLPVVLFFLVGLHFVVYFSEHSEKSWDYRQYETAAQRLTHGENPYQDTNYLYPPLTAQALAVLDRVVESARVLPRTDLLMSDGSWELVFYLYQCAQFLLVLLAYRLCFRFARNLGIDGVRASILVAVLLVFNSQVLRTVKLNNVNLWMLDLILIGVLFVEARPWASGLAVSLGGHIKLYPLALCLPWLVMRKGKAILWSAAGIAAILLVQTGSGRDFTTWRQFIEFSGAFPHTTHFRDNSLFSLIYNLMGFGGLAWYCGTPGFMSVVKVVVHIAQAIVAAWFALRFWRREKAYSAGGTPNTFRMYGHSVDALALALLMSPLVWEYHYVLMIPSVILAFAMRWEERPWLVAIAAFLMFGLPSYDVFPFAYNRIAGLLIMLYLTSPSYSLRTRPVR